VRVSLPLPPRRPGIRPRRRKRVRARARCFGAAGSYGPNAPASFVHPRWQEAAPPLRRSPALSRRLRRRDPEIFPDRHRHDLTRSASTTMPPRSVGPARSHVPRRSVEFGGIPRRVATEIARSGGLKPVRRSETGVWRGAARLLARAQAVSFARRADQKTRSAPKRKSTQYVLGGDAASVFDSSLIGSRFRIRVVRLADGTDPHPRDGRRS